MDGLFIPMVTSTELIQILSQALTVPLNVMAFPGSPAPQDMLNAGASRVSFGQSLMLAALGLTAQIALELREKSHSQTLAEYFFGFNEADALFRRLEIPVECLEMALAIRLNNSPVGLA